MTGDGLDVITTQAELTAVLNDTSAWVKVVDEIMFCGGSAGSGIVGCAPPGTTMVINNNLNADDTGETLVHELGHNVGLPHRESPGNPIMKASGFGGNEVNLSETAAYHTGGTANGPNRPVDLAFIIDDTGSMTEEIGGVRTALTNHLGTFSSSTCQAFQLTTFKDNVTERDPTTDLMVIQGQVSGLTATGGGDCPEASAQAINQVRGKIKDGGRAFFATDASPHPGQNLNAAIQALRGRGIRVDVMLSGNCVASRGVATLSSNDGQPVAIRGGTPSATEVFFELANQTGGIFAFVPEVNSGGSGVSRYEFATFNIMQGSIGPSIALASPGSAPRGSQTVVTLGGASTNFQPGTTLEIGGDGISITSLSVISSTELVATLQIDPGATTGFRDLIAITGSEVANGIGAFEITEAVFTPTVTGIAPTSGRRGETLDVRIFGVMTNFSASSVPDLGAGVTVVSVTPRSGRELDATITIDSAASIGFRDVFVTTGPEVATETLTGPFFVAPESSGGIASIVSVDPGSGFPGETLSITVDGMDTNFVDGTSVLSFSGVGIEVLGNMVQSPTRLTATLVVAPEAPIGFQDVRVTTGSEVAVALDGFLVTEGDVDDNVIPTLSAPVMAVFVAMLLVLGVAHLRRKRHS